MTSRIHLDPKDDPLHGRGDGEIWIGSNRLRPVRWIIDNDGFTVVALGPCVEHIAAGVRFYDDQGRLAWEGLHLIDVSDVPLGHNIALTYHMRQGILTTADGEVDPR